MYHIHARFGPHTVEQRGDRETTWQNIPAGGHVRKNVAKAR